MTNQSDLIAAAVERTGAGAWIAHDGGPCPVPTGSAPEVKLRDGQTGVHVACCLTWEHDGRGDDIIAYKPEPTP